MRAIVVVAALSACSSHPASNDLTCGAGTELDGDKCVLVPGDAAHDASVDGRAPDAPVDAAIPPDAPPWDAAMHADESTSFAIDPAHDNAQLADTVASPLTPAWTATFTGPVSYAVVAGGLAIVAAGTAPSTVTALDVRTGAVVWGPLVFGDRVLLAYDGGLVFALDLRARLSALDVATGQRRWLAELGTGIALDLAPPVASNGSVYINGFGSSTIAVDAQTGTVRWRSMAYEGTDGGAAIAGGIVYQAGVCDELYAWNAMTGGVVWSHNGTCSGGGGTAPSVFGGKVWERDSLSGNVIYDASGAPAGTFASDVIPAFHSGKAFYKSGTTLTAVDLATNNTAWTFTGDGQLCTSPVVAGTGGQVFVGSRLGKVYELDETTGRQRSVHEVGAAVTCFSETSTLTLGENHLLVPVGNQLVAY